MITKIYVENFKKKPMKLLEINNGHIQKWLKSRFLHRKSKNIHSFISGSKRISSNILAVNREKSKFEIKLVFYGISLDDIVIASDKYGYTNLNQIYSVAMACDIVESTTGSWSAALLDWSISLLAHFTKEDVINMIAEYKHKSAVHKVYLDNIIDSCKLTLMIDESNIVYTGDYNKLSDKKKERVDKIINDMNIKHNCISLIIKSKE